MVHIWGQIRRNVSTETQGIAFDSIINFIYFEIIWVRGRRGRNCMVIEFVTTCAISAYHH